MLEVEKLNVSYGEVQVLWDITLSIQQGGITAILGSNGAGKTTLLKTVMGMIKPSSGVIRFLGTDVTGLPPNKKVAAGLTLVPEGRMLFTGLTVEENLRMGAHICKDETKRAENLHWVFDIFPVLKERKKQIAGTLSGGEQQMLAISRGLMSNPRLMLLDEPSSGLSPILTTMVFEIIDRIHREGITILLVEQKVRALEISDRAYVLTTGRVVQSGTGEEILQNDQIRKHYLAL